MCKNDLFYATIQQHNWLTSYLQSFLRCIFLASYSKCDNMELATFVMRGFICHCIHKIKLKCTQNV